jgi:hypothetical protein
MTNTPDPIFAAIERHKTAEIYRATGDWGDLNEVVASARALAEHWMLTKGVEPGQDPLDDEDQRVLSSIVAALKG